MIFMVAGIKAKGNRWVRMSRKDQPHSRRKSSHSGALRHGGGSEEEEEGTREMHSSQSMACIFHTAYVVARPRTEAAITIIHRDEVEDTDLIVFMVLIW